MSGFWTPQDLTTSLPSSTQATPTMGRPRTSTTAASATWKRVLDPLCRLTRRAPSTRECAHKFNTFAATSCHIELEVPCRDTLDNHMRGKDHIKRATQLDEERLKKGDVVAGEGSIGYRLGPSEMAKLAPTEKEELEPLRKTVRTLKAIVKDQNQKLAKFKASVG